MEGFLVYLIYVYLFLSSFGGCALDQYVEQKADKTALCEFLRKGKGNHCTGKVTAFQPVQFNFENLKFDWLSFCLFWVESYRRILLKSLSKREMSMANNREPINEVANQKTFFRRNESRHKIGWSTSFDRWFIKTRMVFNKPVKIDVLAVKQTCPR